MKKILSIILAAIIVFGLAFGIWYFLFKGKNINIENPFGDSQEFGSFFDTNNSGNNSQNNGSNGTSTTQLIDQQGNVIIPALRRLSIEPVAGYTVFEKEFEVINNSVFATTSTTSKTTIKKEKKYMFRFIERATGHIYETREDQMTVEKKSNDTFQKINYAMFFDDPNKLILQKEGTGGENIDSFLAEVKRLSTSTEETKFEANPFSIISSNFSLSPDKKSFSYLTKDLTSSSLIINTKEKTKEQVLFTSPIKEWETKWVTDSVITLNTKSSGGENGYLYFLNPKTKNFTKIIGDIAGLTSITKNDGTQVLFSSSNQNSMNLYHKNIQSGTVLKLPISTLPEKCVFSNINKDKVYCGAPNRIDIAKYPDDWYKGIVSFDDFIWEINITKNEVTLFYSFNTDSFGSFDMINLELTQDDKFLTFINKKDLTLWSLDTTRLKDNTTSNSGSDF
jgi:hypothetical protein